MWIPAIELRSSDVGSKRLYLLSHLYSPAKLILEAITRIVEKNANVCDSKKIRIKLLKTL